MIATRLYGVVLGEGSLVRVTRGFQEVLRAAGALAGIVPLDRMRDDEAYLGADAPRGILTGRLSSLEQLLTYGVHRERFAMVAPNSDRIPEALVGALKAYTTRVLTPSRYGKDVLDALLGGHPVTAVPHGIDEGFAPSEEMIDLALQDYRRGYLRVLHLASTERQRKGTRELIEAWAIVRKQLAVNPLLKIVVSPEGMLRCRDLVKQLGVEDSVAITPPGNWDVVRASQEYGFHHIVCQPSRAEGWGLVPIEVRAAGGVIVATACTGHADHLPSETNYAAAPGAVIVRHGDLAPIDDHPQAKAPTVDPLEIGYNLLEAASNWEHLSREAVLAAASVRQRWSWQNTTGRALELIK